MGSLVSKITEKWQNKLATECPKYNQNSHQSIIKWLLGEDAERIETLPEPQLKIAHQAMDYRYRILIQRYLGLPPERAYKNLMQRLGSLAVLRDKIRAWLALSRDRQRAVVDVLQEIIQEMLQGDKYIQQQINWIGQCTTDKRLRDSLLMASIEEYCLRPIRNQPLIAFRFVNYLRRSQKGGVTNIPQGDLIKLVSDEITNDNSDSSLNLLDYQAIAEYEEQQDWEETQNLRENVKNELIDYLIENVGQEAANWVKLYLQGRTPEAIATELNLTVKQVYRLREKVSYHAIKVFSIKSNPVIVSEWLKISLTEHNLGLTPQKWEILQNKLTDNQREILGQLKLGNSIETIAKSIQLKTNQVVGEWTQVYLIAQELRGDVN